MLTVAFWKTAAEHAVTAGAAAFVATLGVTPTLDLKDLETAGIAAGVGALYAFVKQLGAVQYAAGLLKVSGK
jgi:hypothetical protein